MFDFIVVVISFFLAAIFGNEVPGFYQIVFLVFAIAITATWNGRLGRHRNLQFAVYCCIIILAAGALVAAYDKNRLGFPDIPAPVGDFCTWLVTPRR